MKKIFVSAVFALISIAAFANPWSYHGPKRDIVTLVVTANYEKPRLLAELIQDENRQPFILLPVNGEDKIYFCATGNNAKVINPDELINVLAYIGPKQIIVLGNEKYVPESYVKVFRKVAPVCVVSAKSWQQAANSIAPMLNLSRLPRNFRKLNAELETGKLYINKTSDANESAAELLAPAENDAVLPEEPAVEKKAPAKKSNKTYPAFDAEEAPAPKSKSAEVAPLV